MISEKRVTEAYVWVWLPGSTEPVVAGRLEEEGRRLLFNYGRRYLEAEQSIPLYLPELPLRRGVIEPRTGLSLASCLRDMSPDAWGRRVILNRVLGSKGHDADTQRLSELDYFLYSGSDRIGALDFQRSATEYVPRVGQAASLEELMDAAQRVEQGLPLSAALDEALHHGTSIGGARPKALVDDDGHKFIAKFSSSSDLYSVVKGEFVAMRLAALAGLDVAPVMLVRVAGKDVLLIRRFDREHSDKGWARRGMVSALTLLGLDEMMARYASYEDLAEVIRHRFDHPKESLRELFGRLVFNVLCGNTDDHARNHAAFWDGAHLRLTPAYDICPQPRAGNEASQAMLITGQDRMSRLEVCLAGASAFLLSQAEAREIIEKQLDSVLSHWKDVCDEAALSQVERNLFWRRQFLNPYALMNGFERF